MIHLLNGLIKTRLTFVSKTHEKGDVWTFAFKPDHRPGHIAGQHGAFIIKGHGFHVFSLANAPEEGLVMIGTHVREGSAYKQALATLVPGDTITMYGPVLNFTFENAPRDIVLLAQGIGITPFRSLIVSNARSASPRSLTLVHSDGDEPAYRAVVEPLVTSASYPHNPEEFTDTLKGLLPNHPDALFYLSGSPGYIKATKATLAGQGILSRRIKTDQFWGYRN